MGKNPKVKTSLLFLLFLFLHSILSIPRISAYAADRVPADLYNMPVNNRIDELVLSQLKKAGIPPSELCSDDVFLRRVYLDVTGTLPRPQETMSFLSDNSSDKRVLLIDKLLEREEYSDYWAMKWSDILRVKSEFPSNLWPNAVQAYHRWIKESLKNNLPYDRFAMALLTSSGSNFREEQTCSVFQLMNEALNQCGMQFQDVVRTWFFLDDILGWYTGFNRVRTDFFKKNIAMEKFLPASTGVGATNLAGAALTASAFAVKPKTELFTIQTVVSPMQSPPTTKAPSAGLLR